MVNEARLLRMRAPLPDGGETTVGVRFSDGAGNAAPGVVCVHGLSRNAHDFDELAAGLAGRFRVACIDMPGRGESAPLADASLYRADVYQAIVLHVMDALGFARAHWVGTSMGGLLGFGLAARVPHRVATLVMNDVGAELDGAELARLRADAGDAPSFTDLAAAEAYFRARYAAFGIESDARWRHLAETSVRKGADGLLRLDFDTRAIPQPPALPVVDLWDQYLALRCPVLVLRGSQSRLLTEETCSRMASCGPRATWLEVPGAGHAPDLTGAARIEPIVRFIEAAQQKLEAAAAPQLT